MFLPKRIYVKPQSRASSKAKEIIERARKLDPTVEIVNLKAKEFQYPAGLSPTEKFLHMKESVILSERVEPFIKTFPSPGRIVERLNTVLNYTWMCPLNCEYCYLQTNQAPEHYFYTNLRRLEEEFAAAPHAHRAILTIWSMLSIAKKQMLVKIPPGLAEYSNALREEFSLKRIDSQRRIVDWLFLRRNDIYKNLKGERSILEFGLTPGDFRFSRAAIEALYEKNANRRVRLIPSEFCDMVAVDHLTGNIRHLLGQLAKTPDIDIEIRTKANQLEAIRQLPGLDRVTFAMSLNTEYIISKYEHGTASLDERLAAARSVQEADGYKLRLVIEPLIKYDGCIQDYRALVRKIAQAIDLKKVTRITLGSARYRKQLRERIQRNFPATELFSPLQEFEEPEAGDERLRYSVDYLAGAYTAIRQELAKHASVPVDLGSETPELWQRLKLDAGAHLSTSVYQFTENPMENDQTMPEAKKEPIKDPTKAAEPTALEEEATEAEEESIQFESAIGCISNAKDDVDIMALEHADGELNSLIYREELYMGGDGRAVLADFDLWDTVDPVTIAVARRADNLWHPVKITGRLRSLADAVPVDIHIGGQSQTIPTRVLEFVDKDQGKLQTLGVPEALLPANISQLLKSQKLMTFMGCVIPVEHRDKRFYRFFLHRLLPRTSMTDLVALPVSDKADPGFGVVLASSGEKIGIPINHPYLLVEKYGYSQKEKRSGQELFDYIKQSLMENLRVLGAEQGASHLERGLEFVILQALSQGMSDGFSNKLHGLVIGPPNVGKSKLTDAAKEINPISNEMGEVGAKQTAAGKIGRVKEVKGVTLSTGGIFPSTSGGTVCVQDFHLMEGGARTAFFAICSLLMEKGVVRDDTSANASLETELSLLVDTNRRHQVVRENPPAPYSYADLDIPINILSRFDFILEIPEDSSRQEQISEHMGLSSSVSSTPWQAELQALIAFLRDHQSPGIISKEIEEYGKAELRKLFEKYKSAALENNIDEHRVRIQRSLKKYVLAIARAWARPVVAKAHIDFAMKFIEEKVSFLASQTYENPKIDRRSEKKKDRKSVLLAQFKGRTFTTKDVKAFYRKEFPRIAERNVQRDLDALKKDSLVENLKHGIWKAAEASGQTPDAPPKPIVADVTPPSSERPGTKGPAAAPATGKKRPGKRSKATDKPLPKKKSAVKKQAGRKKK